MSTVDDTPSSISRVVGLTSSEGKKRNGTAARAYMSKCIGSGQGTRHPVCLDGFPGPMSIKATNIELFPESSVVATRNISVGVGRGTILDTSFKTVLVENSQIIDSVIVTGEAARSRGNVEAMEQFVRSHNNKQQTTGPILMKLTDLNIARAMNRVALGEEEVQLAAPLNKKFQKIRKDFPKCGSDKKKNVLVKFDSHRISEDRFQPKSEKLGPQRYEAVLLGSYQIYPCALKQYLDAHEVRYADVSGKRNNVVVNHEIYLDYGMEEATVYARHAAALEETYRLFPAVLAEVDPQAFWSAMLWLGSFIQTLEELKLPEDLINAWEILKSGKDKSKNYFVDCMSTFGYNEQTVKDASENWGITRSQDVHLRVATDYAIGAVEAVKLSLVQHCSADIFSVKLHTLDYYIGTKLDNYITGTHNYLAMIRQETQETGSELSAERSVKLFDQAMKSAGFGSESKFRMQDPEKVCDNSGKRSKKKLLVCARW